MSAPPSVVEWLELPVEEAIEAASDVDPETLGPLRSALVQALEDEKRPLVERLRAGAALGVLGDPRIDPLGPSMVPIPAGPFRMGMAPEQLEAVACEFDLPREWLLPATPQHEVELDEYEIARLPVTNLEWARFLAETGHPAQPPSWPTRVPPRGRESHPVFGIPWEAVLAYCTWLSARSGMRYRVPTEAEWEKAARGSDGRSHPWGEGFDPLRANTRETGLGDTTPVGMFRSGASPYGVLDLAGNVEEYTASLLHPYAHTPKSTGAASDERVTRGGCFRLDGDLARCDRRHTTRHGGAVGFRLVRSRARRGFEREAGAGAQGD